MRLLIVFGLALISRGVLGQSTVWSETISSKSLEGLESLVIATPLEGPVIQSRTIDRFDVGANRTGIFKYDVAVLRFRILDSWTNASSPLPSTISITFFSPSQRFLRSSDAATFWPRLYAKGTNWLVALKSTANGKFVLDSGSSVQIPDRWEVPAIPEESGYAALLSLPTTQESLPKGISGGMLARAAMLDCLGANDELARKVVRLLCVAPPRVAVRPGAVTKSKLVEYCPKDEVTRHAESKIQGLSPFQRAKVRELLLRWRVPGSLKNYTESLKPLLKVPNAYADGEGRRVPNHFGLVQDLFDRYAELDGYPRFDIDEELTRAVNATNDTLTIYWFSIFGSVYNESQLKRFGQLLRRNSPEVRYFAASILSAQMKDPEHHPKLYGTVDDKEVDYPDLDVIVAYWLKRLGLERA